MKLLTIIVIILSAAYAIKEMFAWLARVIAAEKAKKAAMPKIKATVTVTMTATGGEGEDESAFYQVTTFDIECAGKDASTVKSAEMFIDEIRNLGSK